MWILCLKNEGILDEDYAQPWMLERVVARKLGLQGEAFENTKQRLLETELIDNKWQPRNWDRLQFKSDSSTERVRKYRKNKGAEDSKTNETLQKRYETVTVTPPDTDTDTDTEITPPISPPGDEDVSPPVVKKTKNDLQYQNPAPGHQSSPWWTNTTQKRRMNLSQFQKSQMPEKRKSATTSRSSMTRIGGRVFLLNAIVRSF